MELKKIDYIALTSREGFKLMLGLSYPLAFIKRVSQAVGMREDTNTLGNNLKDLTVGFMLTRIKPKNRNISGGSNSNLSCSSKAKLLKMRLLKTSISLKLT